MERIQNYIINNYSGKEKNYNDFSVLEFNSP